MSDLGTRQRLAAILAPDVSGYSRLMAADECSRVAALDAARATELGMRPLVAHCQLGLGKLYRRAGDPAGSEGRLATACTMDREMGMTFWPEKAEAELGSPPRNSP